MSYNMFIDDERMPVNPTDIICRTMEDVIYVVTTYGMPKYISFDHDLGEDKPTGYDIAKWLVECDMDEEYKFPDDFDFGVHSQNPIGKKNIEQYMNNYLNFKNKE